MVEPRGIICTTEPAQPSKSDLPVFSALQILKSAYANGYVSANEEARRRAVGVHRADLVLPNFQGRFRTASGSVQRGIFSEPDVPLVLAKQSSLPCRSQRVFRNS